MIGDKIKMSVQRVESITTIIFAVILTLMSYTSITNALAADRVIIHSNQTGLSELRGEVRELAGLASQLKALNVTLEGVVLRDLANSRRWEEVTRVVSALATSTARIDERLNSHLTPSNAD